VKSEAPVRRRGNEVSAKRLEPLARLVLPLGLALAIAAGIYAFGTDDT